MSGRCKLSRISLLAILVLSMCFLSGHSAIAQTNQAESKLQLANDAVNQAFNAVLDAEKADANVTDLLAQLNYAVGILAQAEHSYRIGDSNKAAVQADNVLPITQQITTAAQSAKQTALVSNQNAFWLLIGSIVIGALGFILVLFLVWGWFKRSYFKSLSDAKPEVKSQ